MEDCRYIIKTDDGRYVKAGVGVPSDFTKSVWYAKFYKNEDDAKRVATAGYRWLEKYGKICGGNWPSELVVVKVSIEEQ